MGLTLLSERSMPRGLEPPFTPTCCADTPTQAKPSRRSMVWTKVQSGAASTPPETFSHSTTTVPLNFLGFVGRRTRMRVTYGAVSPDATAHRPSEPRAPADV